MRILRRTRVAAYGLLTDGDQILLCRLSRQLPRDSKRRWTLPGGGIDFGESPAAGMIREVEEETGLIVAATGIADVDSLVGEESGAPCHHIRIIYRARITGGALRHETNGSTDLCQWWPKDQCPELVDLAQVGVRLALE